MSTHDKGWTRKLFEHQLHLKPEQCERDEKGDYTNPLTHALWGAFKAGMRSRSTKGRYVVAEVDEYGLPHFPSIPLVHEYLDVAKYTQRQTAMERGTVHMIFQQVSIFHPDRELPRN